MALAEFHIIWNKMLVDIKAEGKDRATDRMVKDKAAAVVADVAIAVDMAEVGVVAHKAVNLQAVITKMAARNFISPNTQSN